MFTGIIETTGLVKKIGKRGSNVSFWIESSLSQSLKVDQSVSHNGVCLTVEAINTGQHRVTAIEETLGKTNLCSIQAGHEVNLERCMVMNGRLDGHIVQGHIDTIAECISITEKEGSWEFEFSIPADFSSLIIEKGSISLNGISLTLYNITETTFKVAIIPYTYSHTNIQYLREGDFVNVEFDLIGKYIQRLATLNKGK